MGFQITEIIIVVIAVIVLIILYRNFEATYEIEKEQDVVTVYSSVTYAIKATIVIIVAVVCGLMINIFFSNLYNMYGISNTIIIVLQIVTSLIVGNILTYFIIKYEKIDNEYLWSVTDIFIVFFFGVQSNITSLLENSITSSLGITKKAIVPPE